MLKSIGLLVIAALPVAAQDTTVSAERIRQVEVNAMKKMRAVFAA